MVDLNNIDNLYALKEEFSNAIDKFISDKRLDEKISSIKELGFSDLVTLFEGVSETILDTKEGRKVVKNYVKLMKESESLNKAYGVNKLFTNGVNSDDSEMLIKETFEMCHKVNLNDYKKDLNRLSSIVSEAVKLSNINIEKIDNLLESKNDAFTSIDFLFENKKTLKNITEYVNNMTKVVKHVNENISKCNSSKNSDVATMEEVVKGINESVEVDGEEWSKELIERLTLNELANKSKEELFNEYKSECMEAFKRAVNDDDIDLTFKSKMLSMESKLSNRTYNEGTFNEDISNLAELKHTLLEPWQEK